MTKSIHRLKTYLFPLFLFSILLSHSQTKDTLWDIKTKNSVLEIASDLVQKLDLKDAEELVTAQGKQIQLFENQELGKSDFTIGISDAILKLYYDFGDFENSLRLMQELIIVLESKTLDAVLAEINRKIVGLYIEKRDFKNAYASINRAEELYQNSSLKKPAEFYISAGNIQSALGIPEKAINYYTTALHILQENGAGIPLLVSKYNIASNLITAGDYDKALEYLKDVLVIGEPMMGKNHPQLAQTYMLMGIAYGKKNDFDTAKHLFEKTESIYLNTWGEIHPKTAVLYQSYGELLIAKEYYGKAQSYLEKSLAIRKKLFGEQSGIVAFVNYVLGKNAKKQKKYEHAIDYFNTALLANTISNTAQTELRASDISLYWVTLSEMASAYLEADKELHNRTKDYLKQAQFYYSKVDSITNLFRHRIHNLNDQLEFSKEYHKMYFGAIESHLINYDANNSITHLERAFEFAEKNKSVLLRQILKKTEVNNFLNIPETVISLEKSLALDKAFYQSKISQLYSDHFIDSLQLLNHEKKLIAISQEQDSLDRHLQKEYRNYYKLKYENEIIGVKKLQTQLKQGTTLIEFAYYENTAYAFIVDKKNVAVHKLEIPHIEQDIALFSQSILQKDIEQYKHIANKLYVKLVHPFIDNLGNDELIIVPDGPLWGLNFELLLTEKGSSNNYKELSYLFHNFTISYANSATVLFKDSNTKEFAKNIACLAFSYSADKSEPNANSLSLSVLRNTREDLPGTRKEITEIAQYFDGNYYYGSKASEAHFKAQASEYAILHLALHGEVNEERPNDSKLFFTKDKDSIEDSFLHSHELFALNLTADLAVLSACNTGSGKINSGEGIMSLGNAFQYAGTKSLLLSKWEVSDATTPEIMKYFYKNLKKGMTKSKALQQAKILYLENAKPNRSHPFYWGNFYLVGDTSPLELSQKNTMLYVAIGAILLLFLIIFNKRFKR